MKSKSLLRFASALLFPCALACGAEAVVVPPAEQIHAGWLKMYDLQFDDAHRVFAQWKQSHPADPMVFVSEAAAFLFAELARLGALESEFFVQDERFLSRAKLHPDPQVKAQFMQQIQEADRLADAVLLRSAVDENALFVKSLSFGLRADYFALIEKQTLTPLAYTKEARLYADRLLAANPKMYDAYLGPGVEQYLLSLKPAPIRMVLRWTGSRIDREKGIEQLKVTAAQGRYLEPFAKLLLAVAALRDKNQGEARRLLAELHQRFPHNELYLRELNRLPPVK